MQPFQLRRATSDDFGLTYEITKEVMSVYVEQTWGRWDEDEQLRKHADNYTPDTHQLIPVEDRVAGFVATEAFADYVWLVKLYLLPAFRGRGIGTAVLTRILRDSDGLGKPVRLRVLRVNARALALYARHGFDIVEQTAERIFMERAAR